MPWPVFAAGQILTADDLHELRPRRALKTAATDRNTTIVVADDPDLVLALEAGTWHVRFVLRVGGTANNDGMRTAWTTPSGTSGVRMVKGPNNAGVTDRFATTVQIPVQSLVTEITYNLNGAFSTSNLVAEEEAILTLTNAGDVAIAWAQVTSHSDDTRMGVGSFAWAQRED